MHGLLWSLFVLGHGVVAGLCPEVLSAESDHVMWNKNAHVRRRLRVTMDMYPTRHRIGVSLAD